MDVKVDVLPVDMEWTTKVAVAGRLDANSSAVFEKQMEQILSRPTDLLIMDLGKVSYISSAGIRALIGINKTLADRDGRVLCLNMQPQIAKVMEVIQALPGLHVFKNDKEMDAFLAKIQKEVTSKAKNPNSEKTRSGDKRK